MVKRELPIPSCWNIWKKSVDDKNSARNINEIKLVKGN